jgi:hypothetical protein
MPAKKSDRKVGGFLLQGFKVAAIASLLQALDNAAEGDLQWCSFEINACKKE